MPQYGHEDFAFEREKGRDQYPPMHPWCRSTTVAVIEDEDLERLKRSAYDPLLPDVLKKYLPL